MSFSLLAQALFGHFFKGLIDHLVLNHKQLLSVERENHKVRQSTLAVCIDTFFFMSQFSILSTSLRVVLFDTRMQVLQSRGELHEDAQARYDESRKCDHISLAARLVRLARRIHMHLQIL